MTLRDCPVSMADFAPLLDSLNPQQRTAVTTGDGPLLVIAGAGSGKTRVITYRIAWLIRQHGVAPWEIFAATFTNKAAEEMRHRIARLIPGADTARLAVSTFHSLCVGILRREAHYLGLDSRFTICDDVDQMALIKDCMKNMGISGTAIRPEQIRNWIATAKIMMLDPAQARAELNFEYGLVPAKVYEMYQERLLVNDAVDFDDLILHVVRIFQNHPDALERYQDRWRYILVDEYQDTNRVQFELIRLLAQKHGHVCAVGDEDQSIYSWRGAEIENLLKFPEFFPGTRIIRLEQNYRSTETILRAASHVIARNTQRMGKDLWSERGQGEPITMITGYSERDEAAQVVETIVWLHKLLGKKFSEIAIFYRVNALSRVFEDQLRPRGIPYRVIGGIKFYDRAEVKDLLAYLRICVNPRDSAALTRIVNKPARGIGDKSLAKIFSMAVQEGISLWDCMARLAEKKEGGLSGKARAGILDLIAGVKAWSELAETHPPQEALETILRDTQYEESLGGQSDLEAISRRENIGELLSALEDFHKTDPGAGLSGFLERVALVNAQDDLSDEDAVSLMTLHCAKGLEYSAVFIVGMEDPIFPSGRAVSGQGHYEEERRLFYVGITRAKDLLFLSRADSRLLYGRPAYNPPSLFLGEIPGELMRAIEDARRAWSDRAAQKLDEANETGDAHPSFHEEGMAGEARKKTGHGAQDGLFPIGSRVTHHRLGNGKVIGVSGEGDWRKVAIRFDAGLEMEVLERHGGLESVRDEDLPY